MCDAVSDCLAVEEANVIEGGSSDGEALLAVPNDVPLVWTQAVVGELWEEGGEDNTHRMFYSTRSMTTWTHLHQSHILVLCKWRN